MFYSCLVFSALSLSVYPYLFVVLLGGLGLMLLIVKFAMRTSTDALRYDAISRSPINSYF